MTLSPELRQIVLGALILAFLIVLAWVIWRRRRDAAWSSWPRRANHDDIVMVTETPRLSEDEWLADFERTTRDLLGDRPSRPPPPPSNPPPVYPSSGYSPPAYPPPSHPMPPYPPLAHPPSPPEYPYDWATHEAGLGANGTGNHAASDATLQLLPGRLEALSGYARHEVRFVQRNGLARFTFGRAPGSPAEHVQLNVPTVSRMHAFMEYVDGRWRIGNLSSTNAVVVNGQRLNGSEIRVLDDGDQIEMGEVVFRFRER